MHPDRMLTDRELRNFGTFLRRTGLNRPEGAFDSLPPSLRRLPSRGIPLRAFREGGAFDEEPDESKRSAGKPSVLLRMLAEKLSSEEWAALRQHLLGEEVAAEDDDPDVELARRDAPAMDSAARRSFLERYPDAARIGADPYPRDPRQGAQVIVSREASESFARMFPDAARIRQA